MVNICMNPYIGVRYSVFGFSLHLLSKFVCVGIPDSGKRDCMDEPLLATYKLNTIYG